MEKMKDHRKKEKENEMLESALKNAMSARQPLSGLNEEIADDADDQINMHAILQIQSN